MKMEITSSSQLVGPYSIVSEDIRANKENKFLQVRQRRQFVNGITGVWFEVSYFTDQIINIW